MDSTTDEKIVRLLARLVEMQVMEQNALAARDANRLVKAEQFVSLVKNQLLELKPDIVFPEFPAWYNKS
jgi:hypothetical protein